MSDTESNLSDNKSENSGSRKNALLNSDERFRLLVESARDYAMLFLDVDNRIIDWNVGAERIIGYSEDEIIGQFGSIIFTQQDIAAGEHEKELQIARSEGRAEDERWHVRKDGSLFWASGIMMGLRDEAGNLVGFAKVLRDFTERRCIQEERDQLLARENTAREEAEAANRARDKFIGVISHELRSPLQTILGWIDLMCSGQLGVEDQARAIEIIQRNAALQNRLINDLLDITRIEAGTLRLHIATFDLENVLQNVMDNVRPAADVKAISLQASIRPNMAPISGDAERLQQVVTNLLNNAIKFTPAGGSVQVHVEQSDLQTTIQVVDSGIGIAEDFMPHVFNAYSQSAKLSRNEQRGLGLGLSIVHELVKMHGGTIAASSEGSGKGATFTVCLPT